MKIFTKGILIFIANIHAMLYIIIYRILPIQYKTITIALSKIIGIYGVYVRQYFYLKTLAACGDRLHVRYGSFIVYNTVKFGDNCTIEENCIISNCEIGNNVIFAANCSVMSGAHHHNVDDLETLFKDSLQPLGKVYLGDNIWIGTHSVILNNISSNSVVGAGAIVTKQFPEYAVIGGVPAKIIRMRGKM